VKTATHWIRELTAGDEARREELARWGRDAVARIEGFYADPGAELPDPRFTFLGGGDGSEPRAVTSSVIGE
jgi:hypothetical protein